MPTRYIRRGADLGTSDSRANANAIFVDSDDDQLKFTTGTSGTTTVDVVTESQTQTLTNKTLTAPALGAATATSIAATGAITTSSPSASFGYATGAGGSVTQITSRATGVTLNTNAGLITTDSTSLAAGAEATFTVTNSSVAIGDAVIVAVRSGGTTPGSTWASVTAVAAGSFAITVSNLHATVADIAALLINFAVIKAVSA